MTVTYADGKMATEIWPVCAPTFIGKQGADIARVAIEMGGKEIRQFAAAEIREMLETEARAPGLPGWNVGPDKVTLNSNSTKKPC